MSQITRARSAEAKQQRAATIVDAALALEAEAGFGAMAVSAVAERAGIAKGTVFLYFPTKESLGLAVLERLVDEWFAALPAIVRQAGDSTRLARRIATTIVERPALIRMLALLGGVLEHNVAAEEAAAFRRRLLDQMRRTGVLLEGALPFLARGDGLQLQLFLLVLVIGLQPLAVPPRAGREALGAPDLAALRLDLAGSLESALRVHIEGLRALRGQRGA